MFRVVIPARYASMRFPGKPLKAIGGKPLIQWVYERGCASRASEVIVATDDERIGAAVRNFGTTAVMTDAAHESGTDRVAEVARMLGWDDADIVVNLQGDEPMMPKALIDQVAGILEGRGEAGMATLAGPIGAHEELVNPNVVKVVMDGEGRALYFSRAPIPWNRDDPGRALGAWRHIGIYAYRVGTLKRLAALPPAPLELCERLEQLRALSHGIAIYVAEAVEPAGFDVNTPEDFERACGLLR